MIRVQQIGTEKERRNQYFCLKMGSSDWGMYGFWKLRQDQRFFLVRLNPQIDYSSAARSPLNLLRSY
jgi:hypothetical protein